MVKGKVLSTILGLLGGALSAVAAPSESVPEPAAWVAKLPHPKPTAGSLRRLLVVTGADEQGELKIWGGDLHEQAILTFLEIARPADFDFASSLNAHYGKHVDPTENSGFRGKVIAAARRTQSDVILLWSGPNSGDGQWQLLGYANGVLSVLAKGTAKDIDAGFSESDLGAFIAAALGYDAEVVATEGRYLLAKTKDLTDVSEMDGVLICDSEKTPVVRAKTADGCGFVTLAKAGRRYSVFKINSSAAPAPAGTKLMLERIPRK